MPTQMYMTVEGATQGAMHTGASSADSIGTLSQSSHEDEITVIALDGHVFVPTDPQSGQPSGQRVHEALKITKMFDKSSPMLYQALATGEQISKVEIMAYRTSSSGEQEHYFTITLQNATITDIKTWMPNTKDANFKEFTHHEDVSFSYKKIDWTHEVAGTAGSDDWDA
ncbi:MAG: Hcp family type VI secretion system effector [Rhodothalassiaceae bacterium]